MGMSTGHDIFDTAQIRGAKQFIFPCASLKKNFKWMQVTMRHNLLNLPMTGTKGKTNTYIKLKCFMVRIQRKHPLTIEFRLVLIMIRWATVSSKCMLYSDFWAPDAFSYMVETFQAKDWDVLRIWPVLFLYAEKCFNIADVQRAVHGNVSGTRKWQVCRWISLIFFVRTCISLKTEQSSNQDKIDMV